MSSGLKGKLFGGVKVKRARSFSGRDKQKWSPTKEPRDDTATTVSDSETKSHGRRPRRRTTGGSEVNEDMEKARQRQGYSSEQDGHSTQTLTRQQIISMVKKRFGLKPEEGGGSIQNGPDEQAPAIPPPPASPSSPKQQRYEALLDKPGTYPTLPRKEENHVPHTNSTPGVVYLQFGDEIKRAMLPSGLGDLQQVRHMFEQTFPDKIKSNGNNRKTIYIKDNSCGVFYELDNVNDLSNKSHLKVLESRPMQNGPSQSVSTSSAVYTGAQATSTPLPNHSYVMPSDAIHSGVKYTRTTTVTRQGSDGHNVTTVTRVVGDRANENKVVRTAVTEGALMDQRKVALPGLGATLKPTVKRRTSRDPVEDQLDNLTSMLEDALKTGSQDSLHKSTEGSASSSQSSFIDHGPSEGNDPSHTQTFRSRVRSDSGNESQSSDVSPTPPLEGKPKNIPAPPPRASSHTVSRESSLKYSQTLQRDYSPRGVKRDLNLHYQTLPLPASKPKQRTMTDSPIASSLSSSSGSPTSVKYEGRVKDKRALEVKASTLRGDLKMLRVELNQLKQFQTFQARQYEDMIRNVKDQLLRSISRISQKEDTSLRSERRKVQMEEMSYIRSKNDINRHISELESEVEMVRLDVVQKRCIANPVEVQSLNSQLAIISRQVSDLKSQFAELHDNMKSIMASELDVIVQGDKFLKEEPSKLENLVSRCKHVTGTLFTLQKLVSAQEQMKSESQASFSSLEDVDKEVLDSIRSVQREYLQQRGFDPYSEESKNGSKSRQRVRFYDEVTQMP